MAVVEALHTVVMKFSQEEGILRPEGIRQSGVLEHGYYAFLNRPIHAFRNTVLLQTIGCCIFTLNALVTSEYLMAVVEALHTVVMKFSQEEGRLLMSIIALTSSSIALRRYLGA